MITLKEPPKHELARFLEAEHDGQVLLKTPARIAMVHILVSEGSAKARFLELKVDLGQGKIVHEEHLVGRHSYIDADYMQAVEKAVLADERIQTQIAELKLPEGATVVAEPWAYATDGMHDMSDRVSMVSYRPLNQSL